MNRSSRHWHYLQRLTVAFVCAFMMAGCATRTRSKFQVLTRNYNNQRTGANVSEKILKPANVDSKRFGKLFMLPVDDQIYAGVLYAADISIASKKHNVLYVATV